MAVSTQDDELSSVVRALGLDQQNKGTIGRLKAHGGLAHATEGSDGRMKSTVRITLDTLAWEPSITVMPRSGDRKSTRLNSSHVATSYDVFCLKKKNTEAPARAPMRTSDAG